MRTHRTPQHTRFTILPNAALQCRSLSILARGLLAYLLSLPSGAPQSIETLAAENPEGKTAIARAQRELIAAGYVRIVRERVERGRFTTTVHVYDTPQSSQVAPMSDTPDIGEPNTGAPQCGPTDSNPKGFKEGKKETLPPSPRMAATTGEPATASKGTEGTEGESSIDERQTLVCVDLVARLGRDEPRLALGQRETPKVVPLVAEWLARGATEMHIRRVLTDRLPAEVRSPVGLIVHRLTDKMPPVPAPKAAPVHAAECPECARPVARPGVCSLCVAQGDRKPGPVADVARHVAMARELLTARRPAAVAA
ncbi:hypothetical protein ACFQVD_00875 [Streptosporangium amethystogenes subsp. fukuiense]|uniref:Helix-turn-helix domain-containing protein n=1 Tax=Streptosporangium amethystogenes subsp. fukuiense TaxID=698418 RepID=A0ABW2ST95_9ACTN